MLAWYNLILIPAWYMDWYYIKSLAAGAGIKLVPDLSHKKLVLYLIPVLISVSDPIYQTNTGSYIGRVSPGDRGFLHYSFTKVEPIVYLSCVGMGFQWGGPLVGSGLTQNLIDCTLLQPCI